eukprot:scaffold6691_cov358-Prasinococcus_capsulatus_cf.AAC.24
MHRGLRWCSHSTQSLPHLCRGVSCVHHHHCHEAWRSSAHSLQGSRILQPTAPTASPSRLVQRVWDKSSHAHLGLRSKVYAVACRISRASDHAIANSSVRASCWPCNPSWPSSRVATRRCCVHSPA